ncbi:MAG TPA: DUF2291 domain-containing protein [Candidatus Blautia faecipullorum]|nr:DUF2291 domain-containing protein [Candidatus Blautia faecipullorum]
MKKRVFFMAMAAVMAVSVTGCGIVKVVPIGEEAAYSGEEVFDSAAESSSDWEQVAAEITDGAADLAEVLDGDGVGTAAAVSGTAKIVEFNTDTPKYYLLIEPEGYTGDAEIRIQAGGVYSGTALRDVQTVKNFESFTNQTEWSQYGKALNSEVDTQVVAPLALDDSVAGKTVTFAGAATESADTVTITPVSLTIE